jgi:hypothetical protein
MGSAGSGRQLGSDAAELERLDLQGRVLAPATRTILQMAHPMLISAWGTIC